MKLVETTPSKVVGKKVVECNRAVKWCGRDVKEEKKGKGVWKDVTNEKNEDFDSGMNQLWLGRTRILTKQGREAEKE